MECFELRGLEQQVVNYGRKEIRSQCLVPFCSHKERGERKTTSRKEELIFAMSDLEKAMMAIIETFHQYSGKEGDKHKLKKSELKELINSELSHFLGEIKEQETVDKVMETLDADGDAECDFQEFVAFIAVITSACHEFFEHE
uniref:Protein S100-B n=2 Tax=Vombatus ursinus TaxID=29139 RepID=A0A4X2M1C5_VOMUR